MRTRMVAALGVLLALGLLWSATPSAAQDDDTDDAEEATESVRGTLTYQVGEGAERETVPVEGVEILVTTAFGEEVGTATSDEDGVYFLGLPGPGAYVLELDEDTIPDEVELENPDRVVREITVAPNDSPPVAFPMKAEGADSRRQVTSDFDRFLRLSVEGIQFGLAIAMMAVGLSLIFGTTGMVNFAHGELVAFGAIVAWYLNVSAGLFLPWAALLAVIISFFAGALLDRGLWRPLRHRGSSLVSLLVISIGLSILVRYVLLYVFSGRSRSYGDFLVQPPMNFGPITIVEKNLWSMGISIVVLTTVGLVLMFTRTGKAIRAVSDDPDLAASSGIPVDRVIMLVWGAGAAMAALGGVLFAIGDLVRWDMGFKLLLLMFAGVILGGLGTAFGAFVGSLVVGWFIQVSTLWVPTELKNVGALGILIVVLLIRPQGILGRRERVG